MPDTEVLQELGAALDRAEQAGFDRGYAQARAEFGSAESTTALLSNALADTLEAVAGRVAVQDAGFSNRLHELAGELRQAGVSPAVRATHPQDGSTSAKPDDKVVAAFDVELNEASAVASVTVAPASGGKALEGETTYADRQVTFTPAHGLSPGVEYRVTVDGAKSAKGRTMADSFSWSFTVVEE